jgi:hypothetical protein
MALKRDVLAAVVIVLVVVHTSPWEARNRWFVATTAANDDDEVQS